MKRLFALAAAVIAVGGFVAPASAQSSTRVITQPGQIPLSTQDNIQKRFNQLGFGTYLRAALGSTLGGGLWSNVNVIPNGGMTVAVQPGTAGTAGLLLQLGADDTNTLPQNATPQLSADTTQIVLSGIQSGASGSIGPMSAPGSGFSQYYLLEAQLQQIDTNAQSIQFVSSGGASSYATVNTYRVNQPTYQLKAGTAASSPTIPSADSGWFPVATILVPSGTATITSGMISMVTSSQFQGFVANGSTVTVSGLTLSGFGAGCLQTNSSGVVSSQPCTSGLGAVNGTTPIVSNTVTGTATVSCPTCVTSVSGGTGTTSTGGTTPSIALSHGDYLDQSSTAQTKTGALTTGAFTSTGNIAASTASGTQISAGPAAVLQSTGTTSTNNSLNVGFTGSNSGTLGFYPNGFSSAAVGQWTASGLTALATGTATSSTSYASNLLQLQDSVWNGASAVNHLWSLKADNAGNLLGAYDGSTKWTLSNAGAVTATGQGTFVGVNVGGALTGATTGAFSGSVTTGALTASSVTSTGGVSVGGPLTNPTGTFNLNGATAQVITSSSATSGWAFTNAANSATNVSWTDAGALTARSSITAGAGMSVGGALTNATTGTFSGAVSTGALTNPTGTFNLNGATAQVITSSSATSGWAFTNAANSATNVSWTDAGALTARSSITAGAGMSVGGALTNATTGSFSGAVGVGAALNLVNDTSGAGQTSSEPWIAQDGAATKGINFNVPTSSTYGLRMLTNLAPNGFQVTAGGALTASSVTSSGGVAVGGALTGATTGSFSAQLSVGSGYTNGSGVVAGIAYSAGAAALAFGSSTASGGSMDWGLTHTGAFSIQTLTGSSNGTLYAGQVSLGSGYLSASIPFGVATAAGVGTIAFGSSTASGGGWDFGLSTAGQFSATALAGGYVPINASAYNVQSRREWKKNITPFDALALIREPALESLGWCYNGAGKTRDEAPSAGEAFCHAGPMADALPAWISGPKHDHVDEAALGGLTLAAVQQLAVKVDAIDARSKRLLVETRDCYDAHCVQRAPLSGLGAAPVQVGPTLARLAAQLDSITYDNRVLRQRLSRLENVRERASTKRKQACPKGWVPVKRGKRVVGCTNATPAPRREAAKR